MNTGSCLIFVLYMSFIHWYHLLADSRKKTNVPLASLRVSHSHHHKFTQKSQNTIVEVWQLTQLNSKINSFISQYQEQGNNFKIYTENYLLQSSIFVKVHVDASIIEISSQNVHYLERSPLFISQQQFHWSMKM